MKEIAAFVKAVQSGTELPVSNTHARSLVEVILAVEESLRTGREVQLR